MNTMSIQTESLSTASIEGLLAAAEKMLERAENTLRIRAVAMSEAQAAVSNAWVEFGKWSEILDERESQTS